MVVVNTAGVATGFAPIKEPGWYDAVLTDSKTLETTEGKTGDPMTTLEFTLEDPREDGHRCWRNFMLSPKALPYIKEAAVKLGVDPDVLEGEWDPDEVFPGQYGTKCKLLIRHRTYQGDTQDDVRRIEPRDFVPPVPGAEPKKSSAGGW